LVISLEAQFTSRAPQLKPVRKSKIATIVRQILFRSVGFSSTGNVFHAIANTWVEIKL